MIGCKECVRESPLPWPIYTVEFHGTTVCAACLTPTSATRASGSLQNPFPPAAPPSPEQEQQ